jgi:hypothetical protein
MFAKLASKRYPATEILFCESHCHAEDPEESTAVSSFLKETYPDLPVIICDCKPASNPDLKDFYKLNSHFYPVQIRKFIKSMFLLNNNWRKNLGGEPDVTD